jgi:hypothetical protein
VGLIVKGAAAGKALPRDVAAGRWCIPDEAIARALGSRRPLPATLCPGIIMPRLAPVLL